MILYVNGDSHTAAAEAVNPHAFAEDDPELGHLSRRPHPDNLEASWGRALSSFLDVDFHCDAEAASSNARILRTTRSWIEQNHDRLFDTLMVIQWSTWERQEWIIDGQYYQLTSSGTDDVPESHKQRYKEFIIDVNWWECRRQAHDDIWAFHQELNDLGIRHVFFNGNNHFADLPESQHQDWASSYLHPYDGEMTYDRWLRNHGYQTVNADSWHFGRSAHAAWAHFMLQYIMKNGLDKT